MGWRKGGARRKPSSQVHIRNNASSLWSVLARCPALCPLLCKGAGSGGRSLSEPQFHEYSKEWSNLSNLISFISHISFDNLMKDANPRKKCIDMKFTFTFRGSETPTKDPRSAGVAVGRQCGALLRLPGSREQRDTFWLLAALPTSPVTLLEGFNLSELSLNIKTGHYTNLISCCENQLRHCRKVFSQAQHCDEQSVGTPNIYRNKCDPQTTCIRTSWGNSLQCGFPGLPAQKV